MDVKRGKGPESVQRPISIDLSRSELLDLITSFLKRKLGTDVNLTAVKGVGTDSVLETISFSGVETVTLNWDKQTPPPQPANPPVTNTAQI